jgi:hypothetical protein
MPYNVGDLSRGPCCEINKLIVQVTGKDHPGTQRLAFYEKDANKPLEALTARDNPETVSAWMCKPSSLHVWDWTGEPDHRMVLEVESDDGPPIQLPLPAVRITTRQLDRQWNQIVPVLPFVALPGISSAQDHGTPVLCRPGYFYVFIDGRLWRELEIRLADERTTYHDIELDKFRVGDDYADDARLATGKALDDIWLPANWNGQRIQAQLCFSEVQLNAARIRRFEKDAYLRQKRCQSPDLRVDWDSSKQMFRDKPDGLAMLEAFSEVDAYDSNRQAVATQAHSTWLNLNNRAFPLTLPAPQRARQIGFEWMLDQPAQYLCDLSGEYLGKAMQAARQHVHTCEAGTEPYRPLLLETGAWANCLEQVCQPGAYDGDGIWQAQPAAVDVLKTARARELHGVMLVDTQYRMRHLNTRIQDQRYLLQLCAERAQQYAHHGSAMLVQQLLAPQKIGGKTNPLHQKLDSLKDQGLRDINRFTASNERAQVWRQLEMSQSLLCECLQLPVAEQSLADHFGQNHFNYAAAVYFVSQLFVTLALRPAQYDPLAATRDITDATNGLSLYSAKASAGQQWIAKVVNDAQHPLHLMLWPDVNKHNLDAPYQPPAEPDINHGDGNFRGTELAKLEQADLRPVEAQTTIDSLILASLLKNGSLNNTLTVSAKAGASALVAVAENMQGAIEAAERAVHGAQHIALEPADAKPWRLSEALHRRNIAQLRSMLPTTFGDMHFLPRGEAHQKNYYVFGLDDTPKQVARSAQLYGVYRDRYGVMKTPAEDSGRIPPVQALPPERVVLGIPRNHRTAMAVSRVNQRFNDAWQNEMARRAADQSNKLSALERATALRDAARDSTLFWALDSVPVAGVIVGLEIHNLLNEMSSYSQTNREKSKGRADAGFLSAGLDLVIAMEALTFKFSASSSALAASRKIIFTISEASAEWLLGPLSEYFVKAYTARMFGQIGAGLLFAGLNLYDAWYSYKWNDDAYIGHLIMAAGGLAGAASTLIASGSTFLGLTPWGWGSLILITLGAGVVYLLSSKPIDDWLQRGPFGEDPDGVATHLQHPETAFYYLVNLFANIRVRIDRNPEFVPDAKLDFRDTVPFAIRSANTRIRIESNLSGFFGDPGALDTQALLNLKTFEVFFDTGSERTRTTSSQIDVAPVVHRLWPDALELFVKTPYSYKAEPMANLPEVYHAWRVRAQLSLNDGQRTWVFPAPPPKDPTPFSSVYAKPDFESQGGLFWADETEYRAKGAR